TGALGEGHRILIEPAIKLENGKLIRPDLVVCKSDSIISVVEMKYVPRGRPCSEPDLIKLRSIADAKELTIVHERYRGPRTAIHRFALHPKAVYALAAIGAHPPDLPTAGLVPERFMHLAAVTSSHDKAIIWKAKK